MKTHKDGAGGGWGRETGEVVLFNCFMPFLKWDRLLLERIAPFGRRLFDSKNAKQRQRENHKSCLPYKIFTTLTPVELNRIYLIPLQTV